MDNTTLAQKAERKIKDMLYTVQMVCVALVLAILAYVIVRLTLATIFETRTLTTVIGCEPVVGMEYYEITVETENGDTYAYYGDYKEIGDTINITFNGNSIIDAR